LAFLRNLMRHAPLWSASKRKFPVDNVTWRFSQQAETVFLEILAAFAGMAGLTAVIATLTAPIRLLTLLS
jgi:hypothetical protein